MFIEMLFGRRSYSTVWSVSIPRLFEKGFLFCESCYVIRIGFHRPDGDGDHCQD